MSYTPVIVGEASQLRVEVESFFDGDDHSGVSARIQELDNSTRAAGKRVFFGTEIEYAFIEDPTRDTAHPPDKEDLYEAVVLEVQGVVGGPCVQKGEIVHPEGHPYPILLNDYVNGSYSDEPDTITSEIRPAPANALNTVERYWNTISAIGTVAAENGLMALILATHLSTTARNDKAIGALEGILRFHDPDSSEFLAATQHNLNSMYPFQLHAGLKDAVVVNEAFPTKDASTAIHRGRLEFRHPTIGVIDPRVDILATLAALDQVVHGTVPDAALAEVRSCRRVRMENIEGVRINELSEFTLWDERASRFVIPSRLNPSARTIQTNASLDDLRWHMTGEEGVGYADDGGQALRSVMGSLRLGDDGMEVIVDSSAPHGARVREVFDEATALLHKVVPIVLPHVVYDPPASYAERRHVAGESASVASVMGDAISALAPAEEAVARRQTLIENNMINEDLGD
ncbi:MAG TPA: hypothetical protein VLH38_04575 [Patescibacteria group bacterium]|nr:hypothetical protein [Patescibacteria group bacterium]